MEYLEGGEIKWRGPEKPLLTLGQTRRIVRDVLLGLEYRKSPPPLSDSGSLAPVSPLHGYHPPRHQAR